MGAVKALKCRECGAEYPPTNRYVCEACFGPLDVLYDYENIRWAKESLQLRVKTYWRYSELLPISDQAHIVDLQAGFTPLHKAERLGEALGLKHLYIKNDTVNPTFSFKDRPAGVGVSKALEFGLTAVGCASTGNLAAATAAHAAKAGLRCFVFIPVGLEREKVAQALIYGPTLIEVEGSYDDANRLASEAADRYGIGVVNVNLRSYYVEGSKTLAFEVVEQLGWIQPDHIIVPVGSGALLHATCKGLEELEKIGILRDVNVKVTGAQPQGCAPVVNAFKEGAQEVTPVEYPQTVAKSLAIGEPGDGIYALRKIRESGGYGESADDRETVEGIRLLAKTEGIFTEPAGGVAVAVLKKLVEDGRIEKDEKLVCYVTGNGLKAADAALPILPKPFGVKPEARLLAPILGRVG